MKNLLTISKRPNLAIIFLILLFSIFLTSQGIAQNNSHVVSNEMNTLNFVPFPFYEDFESGFSNWLVSGQDWDTVSVTYRSPTHCITESPSGNYPVNSNATITLASSIDLSSSNAPVLTFWHRYNVQSNYDFCYVEISTDGGFNWSQLASYTGFTNTLFPSQIDLSSYKFPLVLIRFRLRDNGNTTYDGWYIDDVSIAEKNTSLTPFPFYEDFESGFSNWLVSGQDWDTVSVTYRSPTYCITESPSGNYPVNSNATITLANPIDLSSSNVPVLAFWHRYNVQSNYDFCYVEISEDGGFTWSLLKQFTGFTNTLFLYQIDLSNYKTSPVLIRFRLRDNGNTVYDGWYIDDVSIAEQNTSLTPFPFYEDFENGFGNWLVSGQDWDTTSVTYRSPTHSITESPSGNYPVNSNATITLANPIDLSSSNAPVLIFWHRYNVQTNYDWCYVEISQDGGFNWELKEQFTGFTNTLFPYQIDLSNYKTSPLLIRFRLRDNGNTTYDGWYIDDVEIKDLITVINGHQDVIPDKYSLSQNYPNPFNPSTTISYQLPKSGEVELKIYNMLGQEVRKLVDENQVAGQYTVQWDGRDYSSRTAASGVYLYRLKAGEFVETKKMLLLR